MTRIGSLNLRNPIILAAGVLGDSASNLKAAYDAGAGAVVTKSITIKPRLPRPEPTIIPLKTGGQINAVGLANPGAEKFSSELGNPDYPTIVSLAGSGPSEFESMVRLFKHASAFELNMSCPNVNGVGVDVGDDPALVGDIVHVTKLSTDVPIFVKIGHHMVQSATSAIKAGADGITAINTVPATSVDSATGKTVFEPHVGGLSGPPIKHIALRTVHDLADMYDVPIIGCGGISNWQDAVEFLMAGATAVQIGSAAMNDVNVLGEIADGVKNWKS